MSVLKMSTAHEDRDNGTPGREETLRPFIAALEEDSADVPVLKKLARLCSQNPVQEPRSPGLPAFSVPLTPSPVDGFARQLSSPSGSEFWTSDRLFDQLFNALMRFLDPRKVRWRCCPLLWAWGYQRVLALTDIPSCFSCIHYISPPKSLNTA